MYWSVRKVIVAVVLVATFGAVHAGTATGSDTETDAARVARAWEETEAKGTAAVRLSSRGTSDEIPFTATGTGVISLTNDDAELEVILHLAGIDMTMKERVVGGFVYVGIRGLLGASGDFVAASGKRWVGVPFDEVSMQTTGSSGPGEASAALGALDVAGLGSVESLGTERVRGRRATRYRVVCDPATLEQALSTASPEEAAAIGTYLEVFGTEDPVTTQVWVDDRGLIVRLRVRFQATVGDSKGAGTKATTSYDLVRFGVPMDVRPPPASQVMTYDEFVEFMQDPEDVAA